MNIPQQKCPECMTSMAYAGRDIREKTDEIIRIGDYCCRTCNRYYRLTRRFEETPRGLEALK